MKPRWYQQEGHDAAWRSVRAGNNPCICIPTGGGKSLVMAMLVESILKWDGRVVLLAHVKELLQQNAAAIGKLLPQVPVGIYSAGLKSRSTREDVLCAGIQSVWKRASQLGERQIAIIDEVHLLPENEDTMYRKFLDELKAYNPMLKVIGLTATPYRTVAGCITDCGVIDDICYDADINTLIEQGFLCKLVNPTTTNKVNTENIKVTRGEFAEGDMQREYMAGDNTAVFVREVLARSLGRNHCLIFCSGVDHAKAVCEEIAEQTDGTESAAYVIGETPPAKRAEILKDFKEGRIRFLCNCDVLTTGFDAPIVDQIVALRSTMSPGLWYQICGRGFRIHPSKQDCQILDFGGNIARHGPINSPQYGKVKRKSTEGGEAPLKKCPACQQENHLGVAFCEFCGWPFPPPERGNIEGAVETEKKVLAEPEEFMVWEVDWSHHAARDPEKPDTLRVNYSVSREGDEGDMQRFTISEWICVEHEPGSWAHRKACSWWEQHSTADMPDSIDEAIGLFNRVATRVPTNITAEEDGRFWRVKGHHFVNHKPPMEEWLSEESIEEEIPF